MKKFSTVSNYLKEIVYGGNDGIVTTFAVIAGFTGANQSQDLAVLSFGIVLLFGFANLFADAASMGLGNFLSVRSDKHVYTQKLNSLIQAINSQSNQDDLDFTQQQLVQQGFTEQDASKLTMLYAANPSYWAAYLLENKYEIDNPRSEKPALTALATFLAFIAFGFVPLIPYFFGEITGEAAFAISGLFALIALICLGVLRWRITAEIWWRAIGEIVMIGSIAAIIAFVVGVLF